MIAENNLESHGSWDTVGRNDKGLYRCGSGQQTGMGRTAVWTVSTPLYQRDKNHPAILIWSCGNESFGGEDHL